MSDSTAAKPQLSSSPQEPSAPSATKDAPRLLVAIALVLAALSYVGTLGFSLVYDDIPQIIQNPRIHSWSHAPRLFVEHVWSQVAGQPGTYYRPIFELWFLANYSLFGVHPFGWHCTTVAVHLGVIGLVYLLLKRVTSDRFTAAIATVLFAVHPTHVESVAWVSGVTDPLCALFALACLITYVKARQEDNRRALLWSPVFYGLAMLSKETATLIPVVMLAYDWLIHRDRDFPAMVRRYLPFSAVAAAYIAMRHYVLPVGASEAYPLRELMLTMPRFLWFYVREIFYPVGMSVFHDFPFQSHATLTGFWLPLIGVLTAVAVFAWASLRSRLAAWATTFLFVFMVPAVVGIYYFVPEDLVHDRYLYLPTIGLSLLVALAIRKLSSNGELFGVDRWQVLATLALGALMAVGTATESTDWTNDLILYAHGFQVAPRNVIAINHLANEFYKRKDVPRAMALYQQSLEMKPGQWSTHFALGLTQFELGNMEEARKHLEIAVPLLPMNPDQYQYLASADMALQRYSDAEDAMRRGIKAFPNYPNFHYGLAVTLEKQGKMDEAKEALRDELKLGPNAAATSALDRLQK